MINVFYNKKGLDDILIIKITNQKNIDGEPKMVMNNNYVIQYIGNEIESISIAHISQKIKLSEGMLKWNNQLSDFVFKETNQNLNKYNEQNFVIGKIVECKNIKNTHLHLCSVAINHKKTLQIVCGAKNARKNINVVVAMIGTMMPNGMLITKGKLQGYDSYGMLCSEKELFNKNEESKGILEVSEKLFNIEYVNHFANMK